jgi:hypothetical protein
MTADRLPETQRRGHVKDCYRTVAGVHHVIVVRDNDIDPDRTPPDLDEIPAWVQAALRTWLEGGE